MYARLAAWLAAPRSCVIVSAATPFVVLAYLRGLSGERLLTQFRWLAAERGAVALRALAELPNVRRLPLTEIAPLLELPERRQRERAALLLAQVRDRG